MNYQKIIRILRQNVTTNKALPVLVAKRQLSIKSMNEAIARAESCLGYSIKDLSVKHMASGGGDQIRALMNQQSPLQPDHPVLSAERKLDPEVEINYKSRALLTLLLAKVASTGAQDVHREGPQYKFKLNPNPINSYTTTTNHLNDSPLLAKQLILAETIELIYGGCVYHTVGMSGHKHSQESTNTQDNNARQIDQVLNGNRVAILKGNAMFSMATKNLVQLGNSRVMALMSKALRDFVDGEYLAMRLRELIDQGNWPDILEHWVNITSMKAASLLANGCQSIVHLTAPGDESLEQRVYAFGNCVGYAWAVSDELDQFHSQRLLANQQQTNRDLLYSLPILLHISANHLELMARYKSSRNWTQFIDSILQEVSEGDAIPKTQSLIDHYSDTALDQMRDMPDSEAKQALINIIIALKQS